MKDERTGIQGFLFSNTLPDLLLDRYARVFGSELVTTVAPYTRLELDGMVYVPSGCGTVNGAFDKHKVLDAKLSEVTLSLGRGVDEPWFIELQEYLNGDYARITVIPDPNLSLFQLGITLPENQGMKVLTKKYLSSVLLDANKAVVLGDAQRLSPIIGGDRHHGYEIGPSTLITRIFTGMNIRYRKSAERSMRNEPLFN